MWSTESGDRVLAGAERGLFMTAVGLLAELLDEFHKVEEPLVTRVYLFDSLSLEQKLAMLDHVAIALLSENAPIPKLTAIREVTIGAIYEYLVDLVEMEIDNLEMELRPLILAAAIERTAEETDEVKSDLPDAASTAVDDWSEVIEFLSMQILWDTDWDLPQRVLDMAPEHKQKWAEQHGIDQDYFADIALDPTPEELAAVRGRLSALLAGGA
jgi:hypothetical protein